MRHNERFSLVTLSLVILALWIFGLGYLAGVPFWARLVIWSLALKGLTQLPRLFPAPTASEAARAELRALLRNAR